MKFLLFSILSFTFCNNAQKKNQQITNPNGFAVVELFTSEGCSSCPPADELVNSINRDYSGKNVLVLAYHVDYGDRLGWKDRFSSAANTERQNYYAGLFHLNSIYTPQAVINGKVEFVGSNRNKMITAISTTSNEKRSFELKAEQKDNKVLVSFFLPNLVSDDNVIIALVQKQASTSVNRGENKGKELHHINVVIDFKILTNKIKSAAFRNEEKLKDQFFISAFIQNKNTGEIKGFEISSIK